MSRFCGFQKTASGKPCKQVVEDHHDHCESGHSCPPVTSGLSSKNENLAAAAGTLDVDDLMSGAQNAAPQVAASAPGASQGAQDLERGAERAKWVRDSLGAKTKMQFFGTLRGTHKMLIDPLEGTFVDTPYRMDVFDVEGVLLARGFVEQNEHWYAVHECSRPDCTAPAWVRVKGSWRWYGTHRLDDPAERRSAWIESVDEAVKVSALCPDHRAEALHAAIQKQLADGVEQVVAAAAAAGAVEAASAEALASLGAGIELDSPVCPNCGSDEWDFIVNQTAKCKANGCGHVWTIATEEDAA